MYQQKDMKSKIQISTYNICVIRIHTNEFVWNFIGNIRIAFNDFISARIWIGTYLFVEKAWNTPIHVHAGLEDDTLELEYNNSYIGICTKNIMYSQKGPNGGS